LEVNADVSLQHQWIEKEHTKLPIRSPMLTLIARNERWNINEYRLGSDKLDIEGR